MINRRNHVCCYVTPEILTNISQKGTADERASALATLQHSALITGVRSVSMDFPNFPRVSPGRKQRTVYDAQHGFNLPGTPVRFEGDPAHADVDVNEAYDGSGWV